MKPRQSARSAPLVPVPRMLGAFAGGCLLSVLAIPALGSLLTGDEAGQGLPVLIVTWAAVAGLSGAYLFPVSGVLGFSRDWFRYGWGCLAALQLILFVAMPLSFRGRDLGGTDYLVVGTASVILALLVFGQIAKAARRYLPPRGWPARAKLTMAGLAGFAGLLARLLTAAVLGGDLLPAVFDEVGLLTIAAAGLSGYSLAEALDRSTRPPRVAAEGRALIAKTIRIGVALLVVLHLAWFLYLSRIF